MTQKRPSRFCRHLSATLLLGLLVAPAMAASPLSSTASGQPDSSLAHGMFCAGPNCADAASPPKDADPKSQTELSPAAAPKSQATVAAAAPAISPTPTKPVPALAATTSSDPAFQFFSMQSCLQAGLQVVACGDLLPIPVEDLNSNSVRLSLPSWLAPPFMNTPDGTNQVSVQCARPKNGNLFFRTSAIVCPQAAAVGVAACPGQVVKICDVDIAIPGGTASGSGLNVPVPASALADPAAHGDLSLSAQCLSRNGAPPAYEVTNENDISCNLFACQTKTVELCGAPVGIPGGATAGDNVDVTMPPPFAADHFRVQCLESNGNAPVYEVIDHSGVTCKPLLKKKSGAPK